MKTFILAAESVVWNLADVEFESFVGSYDIMQKQFREEYDPQEWMLQKGTLISKALADSRAKVQIMGRQDARLIAADSNSSGMEARQQWVFYQWKFSSDPIVVELLKTGKYHKDISNDKYQSESKRGLIVHYDAELRTLHHAVARESDLQSRAQDMHKEFLTQQRQKRTLRSKLELMTGLDTDVLNMGYQQLIPITTAAFRSLIRAGLGSAAHRDAIAKALIATDSERTEISLARAARDLGDLFVRRVDELLESPEIVSWLITQVAKPLAQRARDLTGANRQMDIGALQRIAQHLDSTDWAKVGPKYFAGDALGELTTGSDVNGPPQSFSPAVDGVIAQVGEALKLSQPIIAVLTDNVIQEELVENKTDLRALMAASLAKRKESLSESSDAKQREEDAKGVDAWINKNKELVEAWQIKSIVLQASAGQHNPQILKVSETEERLIKTYGTDEFAKSKGLAEELVNHMRKYKPNSSQNSDPNFDKEIENFVRRLVERRLSGLVGGTKDIEHLSPKQWNSTWQPNARRPEYLNPKIITEKVIIKVADRVATKIAEKILVRASDYSGGKMTVESDTDLQALVSGMGLNEKKVEKLALTFRERTTDDDDEYDLNNDKLSPDENSINTDDISINAGGNGSRGSKKSCYDDKPDKAPTAAEQEAYRAQLLRDAGIFGNKVAPASYRPSETQMRHANWLLKVADNRRGRISARGHEVALISEMREKLRWLPVLGQSEYASRMKTSLSNAPLSRIDMMRICKALRGINMFFHWEIIIDGHDIHPILTRDEYLRQLFEYRYLDGPPISSSLRPDKDVAKLPPLPIGGDSKAAIAIIYPVTTPAARKEAMYSGRVAFEYRIFCFNGRDRGSYMQDLPTILLSTGAEEIAVAREAAVYGCEKANELIKKYNNAAAGKEKARLERDAAVGVVKMAYSQSLYLDKAIESSTEANEGARKTVMEVIDQSSDPTNSVSTKQSEAEKIKTETEFQKHQKEMIDRHTIQLQATGYWDLVIHILSGAKFWRESTNPVRWGEMSTYRKLAKGGKYGLSESQQIWDNFFGEDERAESKNWCDPDGYEEVDLAPTLGTSGPMWQKVFTFPVHDLATIEEERSFITQSIPMKHFIQKKRDIIDGTIVQTHNLGVLNSAGALSSVVLDEEHWPDLSKPPAEQVHWCSESECWMINRFDTDFQGAMGNTFPMIRLASAWTREGSGITDIGEEAAGQQQQFLNNLTLQTTNATTEFSDILDRINGGSISSNSTLLMKSDSDSKQSSTLVSIKEKDFMLPVKWIESTGLNPADYARLNVLKQSREARNLTSLIRNVGNVEEGENIRPEDLELWKNDDELYTSTDIVSAFERQRFEKYLLKKIWDFSLFL